MNIQKTMENLQKNNIRPYFLQTKEEVVPLLKTLLQKGDCVSCGGSVTLTETGVLEHLRCGDYRFLDRYAPNLTKEEVGEIFRQSFFADAYLCSSNAVTESGMLYNADGNANRIAALAFGPKKVVVVAGVNKIVPDLAAAQKRVRTVSAPKNAKRLGLDTYCAACGTCVKSEADFGEGCDSPDRICRQFLVTAKQTEANRIHVILVNEPLGY